VKLGLFEYEEASTRGEQRHNNNWQNLANADADVRKIVQLALAVRSYLELVTKDTSVSRYYFTCDPEVDKPLDNGIV